MTSVVTQTRPLTVDDAPAMAAIAADCFERPWSLDTIRDELQQPGRDYLGTFADGVLVGYVGTADLAGALHVMTAAVAPDRRRRGIARRLVSDLLGRARKRGHTSVTLEVRESDGGATALYAGLGFEVVGTRPGYYGDDAALIMTRSGP